MSSERKSLKRKNTGRPRKSSGPNKRPREYKKKEESSTVKLSNFLQKFIIRSTSSISEKGQHIVSPFVANVEKFAPYDKKNDLTKLLMFMSKDNTTYKILLEEMFSLEEDLLNLHPCLFVELSDRLTDCWSKHYLNLFKTYRKQFKQLLDAEHWGAYYFYLRLPDSVKKIIDDKPNAIKASIYSKLISDSTSELMVVKHFLLAIYFKHDGNYEFAAINFRQLQQQINKPISHIAKGKLRSLHNEGHGINKCNQTASWLFQKAAMFNLGLCYEKGQGVTQNHQTAFEWYQKAANLNHAAAMVNLGCCYGKGRGTQKNLKTAFEWFQKAANLNCAKAMVNLGFCCETGRGTQKNLKAAFEWYQKAANLNNAHATANLGFFYAKGLGTQQNLEAAFEWYRKAANLNCAKAMVNLGFFYVKGLGTQQNLEAAFEWYRKAANLNHASAMVNLGCCYEKGLGTQKNLKTAFEWFQKAANLNHPAAINAIERIYSSIFQKIETFKFFGSEATCRMSNINSVFTPQQFSPGSG